MKAPPVLIFVLACGCGSFEDDMQMICDVDNRTRAEVGDLGSATPAQRNTIYFSFIDENAKSADGKALGAALRKASRDPDAMRSTLGEATAKAGVTSCPAAEYLPANAMSFVFERDVALICRDPKDALLERLRGEHDFAKRVELRAGFYDENLKSEQGKKLWATLRDGNKPLDERSKIATLAMQEAGTLGAECSYLEDAKRANQANADELHDKAVTLANAEGEGRDLAGAAELFDQACNLGHEQACREAVVTRARVSAEPKP